jgi:hypothetical protein
VRHHHQQNSGYAVRLKNITSECLPDYIFSCCRSPEELTLTELGRTRLVIVDLSGDISQPQEVCEYYCFLMTQYKDIHWVYIVGRASDREAQIFLARDNSTLVSDMAPVVRLGAAICAAEARRPEECLPPVLKRLFSIRKPIRCR